MVPANFTPLDSLLEIKPSSVLPKKKYAPPAAKESEPFQNANETIEYHEPSEIEEIDEEVKPYVQPKNINPEIPQELKQVGLQAVDFNLYKDVHNPKLPLADEKIVQGLHAPLTSALRWLATFALYLLQQSHLTLKTIHGKVVRVVR